ncbi:MAG: nicotinate-nucleotide adenylyltransferase [Planctomycetaceae bacterium]|nr:nicotinate-nucleotide adenylyltransferase [Planctomycetaceae bacterium]
MRLGIYGGTFDPVHYGHLLLAEQCREQCALDEVWFVPARQPPHKEASTISPAVSRIEMLEFALAGYPEFRVSRIEVDRDGPSYTVETLHQLRADDLTRELFLLIGADSLVDLPTWREPDRILQLATVVAVNRGAFDEKQLTAAAAELGTDAAERIRLVAMPGVDISASDLRRRVSEGRSIRFLTPRPVALYIAEHHLYVHNDGLK